jgi:hypothetical protein
LKRRELDADRDQRKQEREKIVLLLEHFQIAGNDLEALVLALACRHVPGFKVVPEKRRGGRPRKWDGPRLVKLREAVEDAKKLHRCTDRKALKLLASQKAATKEWSIPTDHRGSEMQWIETLESRLNEARKYVAYIDSLPNILKRSTKKVQKTLDGGLIGIMHSTLFVVPSLDITMFGWITANHSRTQHHEPTSCFDYCRGLRGCAHWPNGTL